MITSLLPYLLGGGGLVALLLALFAGKKNEGKLGAKVVAAEEKVVLQQQIDKAAVTQANDQVKQVEQVNEVRDTLQSDPVAVERVRSRFQRD